MPDFQVPGWLQPMSEAEKARLNENADAASRKAATMMKRQIGLSRMRDEAQQAVQSGVDPVTARQNALLNNADLLFSENPAEISNIIESEQANRIRDRARLQAEAALAETARHHANLAEEAKARLAETEKYHAASLAQKKAIADAKMQGETFTPSILPVTNPLTGKPIAILRKSPTTSEMVDPKVARKISDVDRMELKSIYSRIDKLQTSRDEIEPEQGAVTQHPNTIKRMKLSAEIQRLRERAKEIETKAVGKEDDQPASEAPSAQPPKLELKVDSVYRDADGNIRVYKGVDKDGRALWEKQ